MGGRRWTIGFQCERGGHRDGRDYSVGKQGTWEQRGCSGNRGDADRLEETQGSWSKGQKKCMSR